MMELLDLTIKLEQNVSATDLVKRAKDLYELAVRARQANDLPDDIEIHVWVEQGSLISKSKWYIALTAFVGLVNNFDSFTNGIEKIYQYSEKAMTYITQEVIESTPANATVKRSAGLSEKITKLLYQVQQGTYTPEEASGRIMKLIEKEEDEQAKALLISSFNSAAEASYRSPWVQLPLFPGTDIVDKGTKEPNKRKKSTLPKPNMSLQGVELWYDKKTGRRELRKYVKR